MVRARGGGSHHVALHRGGLARRTRALRAKGIRVDGRRDDSSGIVGTSHAHRRGTRVGASGGHHYGFGVAGR